MMALNILHTISASIQHNLHYHTYQLKKLVAVLLIKFSHYL